MLVCILFDRRQEQRILEVVVQESDISRVIFQEDIYGIRGKEICQEVIDSLDKNNKILNGSGSIGEGKEERDERGVEGFLDFVRIF